MQRAQQFWKKLRQKIRALYEVKAMSFVIPDEFLKMAHVSEADLKLEIAILLFQQEKIDVGAASQFAGIDQVEFQEILGDRQLTINNGNENVRQDPATLPVNALDLAEVKPSQAEILQRIEQRRTFCPAAHHLPDTLTLLQEDRAR